jgi:hypothetical protein
MGLAASFRDGGRSDFNYCANAPVSPTIPGVRIHLLFAGRAGVVPDFRYASPGKRLFN